jgi:starch phosphorylase
MANDTTWWGGAHDEPGFLVAYFSPEFGLDASLPNYAGGLGVLAGDHLKTSHDLGLPLVGVGLFYRRGYFRQSIARGRQTESYPELDPHAAGLTLVRTPDGRALEVEIDVAKDVVRAQIWRTEFESAPAYLLDANVESNPPALREVTDVLYGPDREHRIRQEVLLGVGGARALRALGLEPTVFHMNEGHAAFLALERIRFLVAEQGLTVDDAFARVRSSTVFTTHTPVPEGNERFDLDLARRYLTGLAGGWGVPVEDLLELGSVPGEDAFGLTPLALRTSAFSNGVSKQHGSVSRSMWKAIWPESSPDDVRIGHVTNGVHAPTWVASEIRILLEQAGVSLDGPPDEQSWERAVEIDASELWAAHVRCKARLLDAIRERRKVGGEGLDRDALTIAYARRIVPYKRASLFFSDLERALEVLNHEERPIQILYAGKAYPADDAGKAALAKVVAIARSKEAHGRVVFLEDYDMEVAGLLVQGADVWLNNPRPPQEASGTSGMKAALNGALNLSVLDGWWPEAYSPDIGWAVSATVSAQGDDEAEATELRRLLAEEVTPTFFDRSSDGLPTRWLDLMRASIATVGARFNGGRMVAEYVERYYLPAHEGAAPAAASRNVRSAL